MLTLLREETELAVRLACDQVFGMAPVDARDSGTGILEVMMCNPVNGEEKKKFAEAIADLLPNYKDRVMIYG